MLPFDSTLANFGAIASIVGLILAVVVTLIFHVRPKFFRGSGIDDEPIPKANQALGQQFTQTTSLPASPNHSLGLQQMLESAKSVNSGSGRSDALHVVAEHAVRHGAYEKAIEAGEADSGVYSKSETLKFVAISAASGGRSRKQRGQPRRFRVSTRRARRQRRFWKYKATWTRVTLDANSDKSKTRPQGLILRGCQPFRPGRQPPASPKLAGFGLWRSPTDSYSRPSAGCPSSARLNWSSCPVSRMPLPHRLLRPITPPQRQRHRSLRLDTRREKVRHGA